MSPSSLLFLFFFGLSTVTSMPYFYPLPNVVSTVARSSSQSGNIAKLVETTTSRNFVLVDEAEPTLIQKKLRQLADKVRFFTGLLSGGGSTSQDDDFQREQDAFDRDFEADVAKNEIAMEKSAKIEVGGVDASAIGVFFMELLGSLFGIVYGAVAQSSAS